jgi:hypothetical protein
MSKPSKFEIGDQPENIGALFDFLNDHSHYNRQIQVADIRMTFSSCDCVEERAKLLLFKIYNMQSQPKLDEMKAFLSDRTQAYRDEKSYFILHISL